MDTRAKQRQEQLVILLASAERDRNAVALAEAEKVLESMSVVQQDRHVAGVERVRRILLG
jgi:septum formation inhibitor-activating ATPase MinD